MSDKHAARKGDDIIHSSIFADITSIVAEGVAYAAIGSAVAGIAAVAAPFAGAGLAAAGLAAVGSSCVLGGIIGGILTNVLGKADDISNAANKLGDWIFPPSPAGKIDNGSHNVLTNKLPAARAAARNVGMTYHDVRLPGRHRHRNRSHRKVLPIMAACCCQWPHSLAATCGNRRLHPLPKAPRRWKRTR